MNEKVTELKNEVMTLVREVKIKWEQEKLDLAGTKKRMLELELLQITDKDNKKVHREEWKKLSDEEEIVKITNRMVTHEIQTRISELEIEILRLQMTEATGA